MIHVHQIRINNGHIYTHNPKFRYYRNLDELYEMFEEEKQTFIKNHYKKGLPKRDPDDKREVVTVDAKYTTVPDIEWLWYLRAIGFQKIPKKLIDLLKPKPL